MPRSVLLGMLFLAILAISMSCEDIDDDLGDSFGDESLDDRATRAADVYQAEKRTATSGCSVSSNHAGFTGSGFMDFGGNGTWIEWNNVEGPMDGEYKLTFRYAVGSSTRRSAVIVNGRNIGNVQFASTGSWTSWKTVSITSDLRQGKNTIRVMANTGSGGPNLDKMEISIGDLCPDDLDKTEPLQCGCGTPEGSCGSGTNQCAEAAEHKNATLSCPSGEHIKSIVFASYGLPTGSCDTDFARGTCHATSSKPKVERACLNRQSCSVSASNGFFGDPCPGKFKRIAVVYTCSGKEKCTNSLQAGDTLLPDERICSANGKYYLGLSQKGELAIWSETATLWSAGIFGSSVYLRMQGDGNLVVYAPSKSLWSSKTHGNSGANLTLEDDGRAVIRLGTKVLWSKGGEGPTDLCPDDPNKTKPGDCGCGVPEGTCDGCYEDNGCYEIAPSGTSNDTKKIQTALDRLEDGDTLRLTGNFVIRNTLYLPANFVWFLKGSLTLGNNAVLDKVGVVEPGVDSRKLTGITEKPGGATNIDMSGGTYHGNAKNNSKKGVRFINFIRVSNSKFHDMVIENASDDNFTIGAKSKRNEMRNLISRAAGAHSGMTGNGLTDKGDYNKWYDCIAEDCLSDGWTPKSRNSEYHRCIARRNLGPGFGLYARLDGSSQDANIGEVISGNKFYACEAYDNYRGGFSMDISSNSGAGAIVRDNFIQGAFYNNRMNGVTLRTKTDDGIVKNNVIDILVYKNKGLRSDGSPSSIGGGLSLDGSPITGLTGTIVAYDNGSANVGHDVDLNQGTNCSITVYNPEDRSPASLDKGSSSNTISEVRFNCSKSPDTWGTQEYCK